MRVGVLGSGLMDGKLGTIFARAGHEVVFSHARSNQKLKKLARDAQGNACCRAPTFSLAVSGTPKFKTAPSSEKAGVGFNSVTGYHVFNQLKKIVKALPKRKVPSTWVEHPAGWTVLLTVIDLPLRAL